MQNRTSLKLILKKPWKIYASYEKGIYLILSGIGSYQSSGAMGFLHSYLQIPEHACYLNLGVAGSSHSKIGSMYYPSIIFDETSRLKFYPYIDSKLKLPLTTLTTRSKYQAQYPSEGMVDMEGSAFFSVAKKCVTIEQIALLKVISDNLDEGIDHITSSKVEKLGSKPEVQLKSPLVPDRYPS